ncbi:D-alanyl-D-alanine-carboxypeptidase/endopeptidase AmpH|nr:D-alanyl-D-alanine-carboxypeptidase/endopeptidase AmpH [Candidatus Pantoea persica]
MRPPDGAGERRHSPCHNTLAAIGSGGVYSTPEDMGRWMQQFLNSAVNPRSPLTRFTAMSDGVNDMLAELVGNQNGSPIRVQAIR